MESQLIFFDIGSSGCKAGLAKEEAPSITFKDTDQLTEINSYPVKNGLVQNWDDMTQVFSYIFLQLKIQSKKKSVLLTQTILNSKFCEKIQTLMFEYFDIENLRILETPVIQLFSLGLQTGLVIDCGCDVTQTFALFDNFVLENGRFRNNLAGNACSKNLWYLLNPSFIEYFNGTDFLEQKEIIENMKIQFCEVAKDVGDIEKSEKKIVYKLPDGETIQLESEQLYCSEILFNPILFGSQAIGIQKLLQNSIHGCNINVRLKLMNNIILTGGTSMFKGIKERIHKELSQHYQEKNIHITQKQNLTWPGGNFLSEIQSQIPFVSKEEYEEYGPSKRLIL